MLMRRFGLGRASCSSTPGWRSTGRRSSAASRRASLNCYAVTALRRSAKPWGRGANEPRATTSAGAQLSTRLRRGRRLRRVCFGIEIVMQLDHLIERTLFASRWLLAPIYLGLSVLLVVFTIRFFRELGELLWYSPVSGETDVLLGALSLIDLSLVAGLIVMVMLSGYENFVSRLDVTEAEKAISWLGKLNSGTLKLKVAAYIVAISAIHFSAVADRHGSPDGRRSSANVTCSTPSSRWAHSIVAVLGGIRQLPFEFRQGLANMNV